jgi:hypothetical protein
MTKSTTVVHLKRQAGQIVQDCDVYIGRTCYMGGWQLDESPWHNPFNIKTYGSSEIILAKYEDYIRNHPELLRRLPELIGKRLGCWCKPNSCHGDILIKLIKEQFASPSVVSTRGDIICNKIIHYRAQGDKHHPIKKDYVNINVTSASKKWGKLSPMKLGPFNLSEDLHLSELYSSGVEPGYKLSVDLTNQVARVNVFENYWQGSKIYDIDLDEDNQIQTSFFLRRAKMYADTQGHRRALPKSKGKAVAAYLNGDVLDYIESRYYYCYYYAFLVQRTSEYKNLSEMLDNGQNLQIIGYDGIDIQINKEAMMQLYLDPKQPFGHELVLCCLLKGLSPWNE